MPSFRRFNLETSRAATGGALRVALWYALFAGLWIVLSDRVVEVLVQDPAALTRVSIAKGWFFVAVTAALLFAMVRRQIRRIALREAKLQTLLHSIPDLVWLKDPDGVYLGCNRAFERYFGAHEADIVGRTDHDFVGRDQADFFRQKDREAMAAGTPRLNEEWITLAETGQRVLLATLKAPMYDAEGALVGVLGIGRDITERQQLLESQARMQAQLNQAQKMELVGRFAGGVAHDYNNMLGVILANAELALLAAESGRPVRKHLEEALRAARHSAALTRQLLVFARQQPAQPRLLDLSEAISDLLGVLTRLVGEHIRVDWKPGPVLWKVRVDPTQLDQILTNLVVNARDAIGAEGCIEIATANVTLGAEAREWAEGLEPGEHVCLSIRDDGCGMDPQLLSRIFEPFFTTKAAGKGTGLGLATVHGAVRQNGGALQVESEPGRGTCFRIYFPRAATS